MRRVLVALATMACVFPATAGAVTFTSDATVTNKDYGTEQVVVTNGAHVTFDNVHWGAFNANGGPEGRLQVQLGATATVKNSKFGPGGCSDGIQVSGGGGADGIIDVTNTEFVGLRQGSCGPHVDAVQFYGGHATNFSDNYVHDVSTGVMGFDSNGQIDVFKNNVLVGDEYAAVLLASSNKNGVFTHNVVIGKAMQFDGGHANIPPTGNVIKDNVASDIKVIGGSGNTVTNNLTSATFVGGTGRCAYATKSPTPQNTATDGGPIGLNDCGSTPPPPTDADGDGVPDSSDNCPGTPAGTQVDSNGCPVVTTDHTPVAKFTASPEPSAVKRTVTFDASASTCEDTPCTYHWHDIAGGGDWPLGPDGKTSTFAFQGTHPASSPVMVELVVTDADGDVAKVEHDHVVGTTPPPPPAPTAEFTWAPAPITVDPFTLTRNTTCGSPPCTYAWTITLKVTDSTGRTSTVTHNLSAP